MYFGNKYIEFWTLVLEDDDYYDEEDNDEEDSDDEAIPVIDYSADHTFEDTYGLIHPHISTITYLPNDGAPTIILNKESKSFEDNHETLLEVEPFQTIEQGCLSYPKVGKHLAFDGRLLHGFCDEFFPSNPHQAASDKYYGKGIAFLVSIWLDYSPPADPLPEEMLCKMNPPGDYYSLGSLKIPDALETFHMREGYETKEGDNEICNREVMFSLSLKDFKRTNRQIQEKAGIGGTVLLEFHETLALEIGEKVYLTEEEFRQEELNEMRFNHNISHEEYMHEMAASMMHQFNNHFREN